MAEAPKPLVRLPFISDEMREEFGHDLRLIDNDRQWTAEAVDFACVVVAPAVQAEIERLQTALKRYEDLEIHLSTGGKPDERVYTRKDVEMLVAVCRAGERAAFEGGTSSHD